MALRRGRGCWSTKSVILRRFISHWGLRRVLFSGIRREMAVRGERSRWSCIKTMGGLTWGLMACGRGGERILHKPCFKVGRQGVVLVKMIVDIGVYPAFLDVATSRVSAQIAILCTFVETF